MYFHLRSQLFQYIFSKGFQVISKRELRRNDPTNLERLQEKLAKVREWEKKHKKRDSDPGYVQIF